VTFENFQHRRPLGIKKNRKLEIQWGAEKIKLQNFSKVS